MTSEDGELFEGYAYAKEAMGRASVVMRLDSMGDVPGGAFQGDRITRDPIPAAN